MFLLRKLNVSCGNLQRQTPVLGFGRKTLFRSPQGESLTGQAGEKAGLSVGLGSSREDHLSVLTSFFLSGCLAAAAAGGEAAVVAPMEGCGGGAAPALSHSSGPDCGFLGNHPGRSKRGAELTLIKAFLTSLKRAGSILRRSRVRAGTKPPSWGRDAPAAHCTEVSPGRWGRYPAQHEKAQKAPYTIFWLIPISLGFLSPTFIVIQVENTVRA